MIYLINYYNNNYNLTINLTTNIWIFIKTPNNFFLLFSPSSAILPTSTSASYITHLFFESFSLIERAI